MPGSADAFRQERPDTYVEVSSPAVLEEDSDETAWGTDGTGHGWRWMTAAVSVALLLPAVALATPPANDNRASAEVIPSFPATVQGTTVEATVERLDPQVSDCGRVEGTLLVPDQPGARRHGRARRPGRRARARAAGLRCLTNSIDERDCDVGEAGAARRRSRSRRSAAASYLVLVGKTAGNGGRGVHADGAALPAAGERHAPPGEEDLAKLPAKVTGSTFGATTDDNDPESAGCQRRNGLVRAKPRIAAERLDRDELHAQGDLDATLSRVANAVRSRDERRRLQADRQQGQRRARGSRLDPRKPKIRDRRRPARRVRRPATSSSKCSRPSPPSARRAAVSRSGGLRPRRSTGSPTSTTCGG